MPLKDYEFWIDANLPLKCKGWLEHHFGVRARHVLEMIALLASDESFYLSAKATGNVIILSKDGDFVELLSRLGPRPKILWITAGNLSNTDLHKLLKENLEQVVSAMEWSKSDLFELTN